MADSQREQTHTRVGMGRRDCCAGGGARLVRSNTFSTFYIPSKVTGINAVIRII